ncbi:MAG: sulfatase-like hydrolase/transferase [Candidatus Limiplasma sp.]|nr:sulfatase-like hydrolase/transferase [Candidatus Limiplasma sp.]
MQKNHPQRQTFFIFVLLGLLITFGMSVYRPIALFMNNVDKLTFLPLLLTLVAYFVLTLVVYFIFYVLSKRILIATIFSLLLHSIIVFYIHIKEKINSVLPQRFFLAVFIIFTMLLIAISVCLRRRVFVMSVPIRKKLTIFLTVSVYAFLGFTVISKLPATVFQYVPDQPVMSKVGPTNESLADDQRPNIYFILLDEYAGFNMVKKQFGYDNSAFFEYLLSNNFYVSQTSENEIAYTEILSSNLLALDYVAFADDLPYYSFDENKRSESDMRTSLYQNKKSYRNHAYLFDLLRSNHYRTYAIDNADTLQGWGKVNADEIINISIPQEATTLVPLTLSQNDIDYWVILWNSSIFYEFSHELFWKMTQDGATNAYHKSQDIAWQNTVRNAKLISSTFDTLATYRFDPRENIFLYAHIMCPHLPFIFTPEGEFKSMDITYQGWNGKNAYVDNLRYATNQVMRVIDNLLAIDPDSVIILQSDHGARIDLETEGPFSKEYLPILNAVYYRGETFDQIEGLSGVNTMRAILSQALSIELPAVESPVYIRTH